MASHEIHPEPPSNEDNPAVSPNRDTRPGTAEARTEPTMPRRPREVPLPHRMRHLRLDERGYPILATIPHPDSSTSTPDFGAISEVRKLVVAAYDFCGACGQPFTDDNLRWQVITSGLADHITDPDNPDDLTDLGEAMQGFAEAPVHRVCALYAAQVCPFVSSPYARLGNGTRRGQRRGDVLTLLGYRTTSDVFIRPSEIQPEMSVLFFNMTGHADTIVLHTATDAHTAYQAALATDTAIVVDEETQTLVEQVANPANDGLGTEGDAAPLLAGAVLAIGGVFLDDFDRITKGNDEFRDPARMIAAHFAHRTGEVDWRAFSEPYLRAAYRWVSSRDTLPDALARWHEIGRHTTHVVRADGRNAVVLSPTPQRSGPPRRPTKARPGGAKRTKAQRAARRKHRR